jgi:hypothetical protein
MPSANTQDRRRVLRIPLLDFFGTGLVLVLRRPLRGNVVGGQDPLAPASLVEDVDGRMVRAAERQEHESCARDGTRAADDRLTWDVHDIQETCTYPVTPRGLVRLADNRRRYRLRRARRWRRRRAGRRRRLRLSWRRRWRRAGRRRRLRLGRWRGRRLRLGRGHLWRKGAAHHQRTHERHTGTLRCFHDVPPCSLGTSWAVVWIPTPQ